MSMKKETTLRGGSRPATACAPRSTRASLCQTTGRAMPATAPIPPCRSCTASCPWWLCGTTTKYQTPPT